MKFFSLLKKELREMLNIQTVCMLVLIIFMMISMGGMMNKAAEEESEESGKITICDLDDTTFSKAVLHFLESPVAGMKNEVNVIDVTSDDYAAELKKAGVKSFVIIPEGFEKSISEGKQADIIYVSRMSSLAALSNVNAGSEVAVELIGAAVKTAIYQDKTSKGALTEAETKLLEAPLNVEEQTIVANKSANVKQILLYSSLYSRSLFMPLVVYILILLGSQTMINAVSAEKLDKTLETLLSAPVSRMHVLSAKMIAAAIVALMNAAVYMIGMNKMNMNAVIEYPDDFKKTMEDLGLTFGIKTYLLIGVQMLLTMLIALSISLILGAFAKSIKSSQTLLLPLMFVTIVPFMASMMIDVTSLPKALRYLLYVIPFTHTFIATDSIIFGKTALYIGGLIYQVLFLVVCMTVAIKIFTSDMIFTASERVGRFGKKKKAHDEN